MNIVRIPRLLKQSAFLAVIFGSGLLLTACGGSDNKSTASSSSSSSSSHAFSSTPITPPGSGTWPDVKVSSNGKKSLKFEWSSVAGATYYKLLKKVDANSSYQQVGSNFTDTSVSDPVSVHLTDWVNSRYKVQACNDSGCQDSSEIATNSAMLTAITYIKASNTEANDWFGWSLAISADGSTMAIGAPAEASTATGVNGNQANNDSPTSGAVYVFVKADGTWTQQAYLKASNTARPNDPNAGSALPNARFGYQVALSADGNNLAVTALNEHSPSRGVNCYQDDYIYSSSSTNSSGSSIGVVVHDPANYGAVYIFQRENSIWSQKAYIKAFNSVDGLNFGSTLAMSGDGKVLAVGTPYESTAFLTITTDSSDPSSSSSSSSSISNLSSSASSCYNYNASLSSTSDSNTSSSSSSNSSSSAVSSNSSSIIGGQTSGAVYIYRETDGTWTEDAFIKAFDAAPNDRFGISVSLSQDGNLLAVGAPTNSTDSQGVAQTVVINSNTYILNSGTVYIFKHTVGTNNTNQWGLQTKIKPQYNIVNQQFGYSVALSGDGSTLAVGTPADWSKSSGINADGNNFNFVDDFTNNGGVSNGYGSTYVYTNSSGTWTQQAYIKASNPNLGYSFGSCVALSWSGDVLAVSSTQESSQAKGINGDQADTGAFYSGAAYLFTRTNTTWQQKSYIKAPNTDAQDRFARILGLDASGEDLLIGAYKESSKATGINPTGTNGDQSDNSTPAAGAAYLY